MKKFKKLQNRFRRKVEKKKLLQDDINSTKKEQLPDPDDPDVSVYGKFEKKNTKYLEKLQKIDQPVAGENDYMPRTLSMEIPV